VPVLPPDDSDTGVKVVLALMGLGVLGFGIFLVKRQLDVNAAVAAVTNKNEVDTTASQHTATAESQSVQAPTPEAHAAPPPRPPPPPGPYKPDVQVWVPSGAPGEGKWFIADGTGHIGKPMSPQPPPPADKNEAFRAGLVKPPPLPKPHAKAPPPSGVAQPPAPTPSGVARPPSSTPSGIAAVGNVAKTALPMAQQALGALSSLTGGGAGSALGQAGSALGNLTGGGGSNGIGDAMSSLGGMFGS